MLRAKKFQGEILLKMNILFSECSTGKLLHFGQQFKIYLELVNKNCLRWILVLFLSFHVLRYCWIGAFSILLILIKSQHCSWKADASCQVHIPVFHQIILMDVLNPSHHWVLCPKLIFPPQFQCLKLRRE